MTSLCAKHKPRVTLECISGSTVGDMLQYMGFGSTLIIYGMLENKPLSGIDPIPFIGKKQTIETFLLNLAMQEMSLLDFINLILKIEKFY